MFAKKNVILKYKDTPEGKEKIKGEFKLIGTVELDPALRVRMYHEEDSKVPNLFDVKLSGDIRLKLDAALAVQLKEELKTNILTLGYLQLGAIPIGTTPIMIKPTLKLTVTLGVKGEVIAKMSLYDYSYHYSYLVGYSEEKGFYQDLGGNKGYRNKYFGVENPYTRLSFEASAGLSQDFRLGLYFGIVGWEGTEVGVGGGLKIKEDLKYIYDLKKDADKRNFLDWKLSTSAYLFGSIQIKALYDLIKFKEDFTANIATWTIFDEKYYWGTGIPAKLKTHAISDITETSAECGGTILLEGSGPITETGLYYSEYPLVKKGGTHLAISSGKDPFVGKITGLKPNTKYYVSAYAKNAAGTAYGDEVSFMTKGETQVPDLTLSEKTFKLKLGESRTTQILTGSGEYKVRSEAPNIATAVLSGTSIAIQAVAKGTANIVVEDTKSNQEQRIVVEVIEKEEENPNNPNNNYPDRVFVEGGTLESGDVMIQLKSFYIGKYEVTNQQYADFLNAKGNQEEGHETWLDIDDEDCQIVQENGVFKPKSGKGNYPVIFVSWYGAKAYAEWVGGRLPSESEWEYAARGGNKSKGYKYSGSDNPDEVAWYDGNSQRESQSIGTKEANELGIYDMSGNAWEWCQDKWHGNNGNEGLPSDTPQDGTAYNGRASS